MTKQTHANDDDHAKVIKAIKDCILTEARINMDDVEVTLSDREGYDLRVKQVPIDHYLKRRIINLKQYRAANRLFKDFYLSGQSMNLTVNLAAVRANEKRIFMPLSDMQREALNNWRNAVSAINGKIGQLMILNVCCYGWWVNDMNYVPYDKRGAISRMKEALDDLVDFYEK